MWLQHRENGEQGEGNEMRPETELEARLYRWDLVGLGSLLQEQWESSEGF